MRDSHNWNITLGRWFGVRVRLNVLFLLVILCALYFGSYFEELPYTLALITTLFVSVLAHEFGHCFVAWKSGGSVDQIVLWPLGGLAQVNASHDPYSERLTAMAGLVVNLCLCLAVAPILFFFSDDGLGRVMNPLAPPFPTDAFGWLDALALVFWVNLVLVAFNLLPAFPLDGGRILRSFLWPRMGYSTAVRVAARFATATAVLMMLAALLIDRSSSIGFATLPLLLLGVVLFFSARQEVDWLQDNDNGDRLFGYDFSQGYTSLEKNLEAPPRQPSGVRQWLENRRAAKLQRQMELEAEEDRKMDAILERLHLFGAESLSPEDRSLLNRVSARYRNRQR